MSQLIACFHIVGEDQSENLSFVQTTQDRGAVQSGMLLSLEPSTDFSGFLKSDRFCVLSRFHSTYHSRRRLFHTFSWFDQTQRSFTLLIHHKTQSSHILPHKMPPPVTDTVKFGSNIKKTALEWVQTLSAEFANDPTLKQPARLPFTYASTENTPMKYVDFVLNRLAAPKSENNNVIWLSPSEDKGVSVITSEGGGDQVNNLKAFEVESANDEEMTESKTPFTANDGGAFKTPINTESSMFTPSFDESSHSLGLTSQEDAKERGPLDMSESKHTTEEQLAFEDQSASDDWPDLTQTTLKDEMDTNTFILKRLQYWKDMLTAKKCSSPDDEGEQSLPGDILDFNASMLDREDYDQMLHSAATNKQWDKTASKSILEKVSSSEQSTATDALLYRLTVLKAVTPMQQHEMVTSLLHPKVRKMQPSLAFEMNALLLDLDTQKLLTMSVDEDALHVRAKKVARAWGVELSSLEDGPGGLAW